MVFGQNLKILTLAKKDFIGKSIPRGAEWRKYQIHSSFQRRVVGVDTANVRVW